MRLFKIIFVYFVFILFSFPLAWQPLHGDETFFAYFATKNFGERFTGYFYGENQSVSNLILQPHFHYWLMRIFVNIGKSEIFIRLSGIFIGLLSITIFFKIGEHIYDQKKYLFLALIMLVTNPLFIQSSLLVDMDNTVMIFSFLVFSYIWLIRQNADSFNFRKHATWELLFATILLYWSKFTAALVNLPSLVIFAIIMDRRRLLRATFFLILAFFIFHGYCIFTFIGKIILA